METLFGIPIGTLTAALTMVFLVTVAITAFFALRNPVVLKMAVRNIPRRRAQTVLIVVGLMLATLLFSASFATGDTLAHSIRVQAVGQLGELDEYVFSETRAASGAPEYIPQETADAIREALADAPVDGVAPAIAIGVPVVSLESERNIPRLELLGLDPAQTGVLGGYRDADGREMPLDALGEGEMYLSDSGRRRLERRGGRRGRPVL